MDETEAPKVLLEDSLTVSVSDGISIEDFSTLREDLETDARDFEAPTWSLAVDQQYIKAYSKEAIKRQDVIYELIQTEINHVRTLKVMLRVYVHELRHTLQMDDAQLGRFLPCLDQLLYNHQHFLDRLKQRRKESLEPGSERNYYMERIGDILLAQFSDELRSRLRDSYGMFCSSHTEAVNFYKDQLQNSKKFQHLMRKIGQLAVVRRLGVPEGILLITQRITKYPVLVERIIKNTEVGSEEHRNLICALEHIKDTISQVDYQVHQYEQLREMSTRLEPKSQGRMSNGQSFRRDDLFQPGRKLLREGLLSWKAQSRTKDVLVVLLSDLLLLLQKNDQKFTFASLDGKPAVLSLHKLLVREAAHNERAMYVLTSDHAANLYELHASTREECHSWRQEIWQAIEKCAHASEDNGSQPVEQDDVFTEKFFNFQEQLHSSDAQIAELLQRKLQLFSEIVETLTGSAALPRRLLLCEFQQGEQLINSAITDVEDLQLQLLDCERNPAPLSPDCVDVPLPPRRSSTSTGYDNPIRVFSKSGRGLQNKRPSSDPQLRDLYLDNLELSADEMTPTWLFAHLAKAQLFDKVAILSQKLYSIKALAVKQDSEVELLRAAVSERPVRQRVNAIMEQEKLRHLDKQREELTQMQGLISQKRQELVLWEEKHQLWKLEMMAKEQELTQRQEKCMHDETELSAKREQLSRNYEEYQQKLERLRDSARAVEKDKEKVDQQLKKYKKHNTISNPGSVHFEPTQGLPYHSAGSVILSPKAHVRPSLSQAAASFQEQPPLVPPRIESIGLSPTKTDVPIQLVSTTNQTMKSSFVQQQIPTKLAVHKGKEKSGKSKGSHNRTNNAASIEVCDVVPIKAMGKERDGSRAKSATKPQLLSQDIYNLPDQLIQSESSGQPCKPSHGSTSTLPVHHKVKNHHSSKEEVIYF
ncbi:rho guanine nucleotide exchange factor 18a [Electrophorus electricus]|uniref:rho guanine nucleotide exchange factor 18a n=1 Tax=Electrophorus electricus TaxID=8005 RepID=UPI0015D08D2D|nr:rho guanine nucleotide exchange factor 18a [Electrophorus electricus]XP_035391991.1 rho guanine nucleotide exchange factor 18a [Electrophorus electricus]XP_035391992.1 rho guanine nucleotide exchange factor 18a [Electrophorus electricus]XP_035391993.1 rho guanine nucleotide exchange factor 18a [Electrophorus electricus]